MKEYNELNNAVKNLLAKVKLLSEDGDYSRRDIIMSIPEISFVAFEAKDIKKIVNEIKGGTNAEINKVYEDLRENLNALLDILALNRPLDEEAEDE